MATNAQNTQNKVETTVNTDNATLTPRQIKAQQTKAAKDAKKQAEADKKANQMVLQIGTHKVNLLSSVTDLKSFKGVVNAYFRQLNLDKKETKIILPNDTVMTFADLNTIKNFTRILFGGMYLDKSGNEETKQFLSNIDKVQDVLFSTPIDWNVVGTKNGAEILTLYKNASKKAKELNVTETLLIG